MTAATGLEVAPGPRSALPRTVPEARLWRFRGSQLDPRNNSLNQVRLVLATTVLFAHGFYIAGAGVGPHIDGENLGGWAVYGFFALSGYLITGSRWSNPLGLFLVNRVARIFPAFLVCLAVMVAVIAPIGYVWAHGTLAGYLTTPTTPGHFVFLNAGLHIGAYDIAGTPTGVPYPGAWNGSLWTLYFEFICYLIIGFLAVFPWVRRSVWWVAGAWAVAVLGWVGWGHGVGTLLGGNGEAYLLLKLLPLFLGGALVQLLRHRLPLHWTGAVLSATVILASIWVFDGWGAQATSPFMAYLLLWVGRTVPQPRLIARHDVSYGVYIYAFPVQQLVVLTGLHTVNLWLYDLVSLAATVPLAVASWLLIERPVMRRARATQGAPRRH